MTSAFVLLVGVCLVQADPVQVAPAAPVEKAPADKASAAVKEEPGTPAIGVEEIPSGIAAIVGDEPITRAQLDKRLLHRMRELEPLYPLALLEERRAEVLENVLNDMVHESLLLQEYRRSRIGKEKDPRLQIDQEAINTEIENRVKRLRKRGFLDVRDVEDYTRLQQKTFSLTREEVFQEIREDIMIQIYLWENVFQTVDRFVRPGELRHYYQTHLAEFTSPVEVAFRQIFFTADRVFAPVAIREILDGLKAGVLFEELARTYSQESERAEGRGLIRRKSYEELKDWLPPIPETLLKMKVGETTGPIRSERGFHFLKLEERLDGNPKPYEDVLSEINEKILAARREKVYNTFLKDLRARSRVEVYIKSATPPASVADGGQSNPSGAPGATP